MDIQLLQQYVWLLLRPMLTQLSHQHSLSVSFYNLKAFLCDSQNVSYIEVHNLVTYAMRTIYMIPSISVVRVKYPGERVERREL